MPVPDRFRCGTSLVLAMVFGVSAVSFDTKSPIGAVVEQLNHDTISITEADLVQAATCVKAAELKTGYTFNLPASIDGFCATTAASRTLTYKGAPCPADKSRISWDNFVNPKPEGTKCTKALMDKWTRAIGGPDGGDQTKKEKWIKDYLGSCTESPADGNLKKLPVKVCNETGPVTVTGDPHVTGAGGEKFDILQEGSHTLLWIPRKAPRTQESLSVDVLVKQLSRHRCESMFVERVRIAGTWLGNMTSIDVYGGSLRQPFPLSFRRGGGAWQRSSVQSKDGSITFTFHTVNVTVFQVRHPHLGFLNVAVDGLTTIDSEIGGILGVDSHEYASTPSRGCSRKHL